MRKIYLDNAATTYVSGEVMQTMMPYFTSEFGNAASIHSFGREAERAVAKSRSQIAATIGANPNEIYFTSGATEANNWIINGIVRKSKSKRILVSAIEHPAIIETCKQLEKDGYIVEYIEVDEAGVVVVSDLVARLSKPAALVSVMAANNEVGTIQYINTLAQLCKKRGVPFHTDAVQALGNVHINVKEMSIDALSLSAHKIYGPKGIGALYIRNGLKVEKFMQGGSQERNRRGGTQNVPAIVGFGAAVEVLMRDAQTNNSRIRTLRDYFIKQVEERIKNVKLNGHRTQRLVNNVNISFAGCEGESVLMMLDLAGIAVSTGSACSSGTLARSHVLDAMNVPVELNQSSVRFSFGRSTTKDDIDYTIGQLEKIIKKLRSMSAIKGPKKVKE
ncbi:MAG: cysteine desulfurase [Firmicutes bacterium]|nr:cysteine desulfurase [Bacillota bacterium]